MLLGLSGCLSPAAPAPIEAPKPEAVAPDEYTVLVSDCERVYHSLDTNAAVYRPEHPTSLQPRDAVRDFARFEFLRCRQAVDGSGIRQGFELALFADQIQDPNATSGLRFAWFPFQVYSNSPSFVANLSRLGLPVSLMEHASLEITPGPLAPSFASYELVVPSKSQADYRAEGQLGVNRSREYHRTDGYYFASPAGLRLLRASLDVSEGPDAGGILHFGPGSYWGSRSTVSAWEHVNGYQTQVSGELRVDSGSPF